jgi:hypothetical protein
LWSSFVSSLLATTDSSIVDATTPALASHCNLTAPSFSVWFHYVNLITKFFHIAHCRPSRTDSGEHQTHGVSHTNSKRYIFYHCENQRSAQAPTAAATPTVPDGTFQADVEKLKTFLDPDYKLSTRYDSYVVSLVLVVYISPYCCFWQPVYSMVE